MTKKYLTVTALTRYIKRKFELDHHLQTVWLKGEISNFKHHNRGHMYFTLKDEQTRINSVMFAGYNRALKFRPENGMQVLIKGEVNIYEPQGHYQVYVHEMEPDGIGSLQLAYEQLKGRLEKEGLFSKAHKKTLPSFPKHIGIITSQTGAAVRDILITLNRRYPVVNITLFPVLVQGEGAKQSIAHAIGQAAKDHSIDVLIVGRGGGSLEELWAFNEEVVARAIAESPHPIISAVGHETDITIADFVADIRAATPTGAAELAVPSQVELMQRIKRANATLGRLLKQSIMQQSQRLNRLKQSYAFRYPGQLLRQKEQELDRVMERLERLTTNIYNHKTMLHAQLYTRIMQKHPIRKMKESQLNLTQVEERLNRSFKAVYKAKAQSFDHHLHKLELLSPLATMKRGYTISYLPNGDVLKTISQVEPGDQLSIRLNDGLMDCQVWGIEEDTNDK